MFCQNLKKVIALFLSALLLFSLVACTSGSGKLEGNWICQETHSDSYPYQIILNNDGTAEVDGYQGVSWRTEDGRLMLNYHGIPFGNYEYELKGSKLYLNGYRYDKR